MSQVVGVGLLEGRHRESERFFVSLVQDFPRAEVKLKQVIKFAVVFQRHI